MTLEVRKVKSLIRIRRRTRLRWWLRDWAFALSVDWRHPIKAHRLYRDVAGELQRELDRKVLGL